MSKPEKTRAEALKRLNERAAALDESTRRVQPGASAEVAVSQAYRIIAELLGGVLVGLALGFLADRVLGTTPWGLISGILLGFGLAIWMARRTANRLMEMAKQDAAPLKSVPFDDDEED